MSITVAYLYEQDTKKKPHSTSRRNSITPAPQQDPKLSNQHQTHYQKYLANASIIASRQRFTSEEDRTDDTIKMNRRVSLQSNKSALPHKQDVHYNTLDSLLGDTSHANCNSTIEKPPIQEHVSRSDLSHQIDTKLRRFSNANYEAHQQPYFTGPNFWTTFHVPKQSNKENFVMKSAVSKQKHVFSSPETILSLKGKDVTTIFAQHEHSSENKDDSLPPVCEKKPPQKVSNERRAKTPFYSSNSGVYDCDDSLMTLEERFRVLVNGGKFNQSHRARTPLLGNEPLYNLEALSKRGRAPRELQKLPPKIVKVSYLTDNRVEGEKKDLKPKAKDRIQAVSEATQATEGEILKAMNVNEETAKKPQRRESSPVNTPKEDNSETSSAVIEEIPMKNVRVKKYTKFQRYLKESSQNQQEPNEDRPAENRKHPSVQANNAFTDKENQMGPKTVVPMLGDSDRRRLREGGSHYNQNSISRDSTQPLGEIGKNRDLASEIFMKNVHNSELNGWESDSPQKMRVRRF